MRFRCEIARVAGMPPLKLMERFYEWSGITNEDANKALSIIPYDKDTAWVRDMILAVGYPANMPIKWESLKPSALHLLLDHSDCDGIIKVTDCLAIAEEMEKLIPLIVDDWLKDKTTCFVNGLKDAHSKNEDVDFH
jgi:hypothetical protein